VTSTISVNADHIARGIRQDSEHCPVALAVRGLFSNFAYVSVDADLIVVQRGDGSPEIIFDSPREVQEFTYAYDGGVDVEPFTFELNESCLEVAS
jgi:hypothetical protein